jgi:predicted O-methyltransferase YrrM
MGEYKYTQNWFNHSEIKKYVLDFVPTWKKNNILEIGCFEGLSSVFFADNLLNDSESTLMCVDPFMTIENNDHEYLLKNNEEDNFDYNISHCKNSDKITVRKITSDEFFETNDKCYNFIYIDGCHEPDFILRDMKNSFNCLLKDGIMWCDDYLGGDGIQIKNTMDSFLKEYEGRYQLLLKGYQLAIRKLE